MLHIRLFIGIISIVFLLSLSNSSEEAPERGVRDPLAVHVLDNRHPEPLAGPDKRLKPR